MSSGFSVSELILAAGQVELADDPNAYKAFSNGIPIIAENSPLPIESFYKANQSEFRATDVYGADTGFKYFYALGRKFYFTFHNHRIKKLQMHQLQKLEHSVSD